MLIREMEQCEGAQLEKSSKAEQVGYVLLLLLLLPFCPSSSSSSSSFASSLFCQFGMLLLSLATVCFGILIDVADSASTIEVDRA